jgi:DNA-binding NtrC family response regulator
VAKFNHLQEKDISDVSQEVLARLMEHDYPGNVRELENIVEQAFVLCRGGQIEIEHLPVELRPASAGSGKSTAAMDMRSAQRRMIEAALSRSRGNRRQAARELGINPSTLYRRLKAADSPAEPEKIHRRRK